MNQVEELRAKIIDILSTPNQAWRGMTNIPIELVWNIETLINKCKLESQLGMIEYYDQAPTNDSCDWKGLLSDNRKQVEYELTTLNPTKVDK